MSADSRILDEVRFRIEAGKIREFALATGAEDPAHVGEPAAHTAGFRARPATLTHVAVAGHHRSQSAMVAALGLDLARVVVGSVSWRYERPLVDGDELHGTRRVIADERRAGKRGGSMRMVTLETDYLDASGAAVVQVRELIIERGAAS
jgi:acyl dehydratase